MTEKSARELEDGSAGIIQPEEQTEKGLQHTQSRGPVGQNPHHWIPEEDKDTVTVKTFEEIMTKNPSNLVKDKNL